MSSRKIARRFYARSALTVAPALLGKLLVVQQQRQTLVSRIVETEAYCGPEDLAAHSANGRRTHRTEVMFGPPGHAYVYLIYGVHHCFNVVTAARDVPHAVLVRALEPISALPCAPRGPGLVCRALGVDIEDNTEDLLGERIWLEHAPSRQRVRVAHSPRVGLGACGAWQQVPWRFFDADSPWVSRARGSRIPRKN